ncbi:MAG: inorganic phosphate transporter [Pirellulales bacterium]
MIDLWMMLALVVVFALAFDYINGFHDTANAIATVVSTRVLSPRTAILMAAVLNFAGAMVHTEVAKTVASGIIDLDRAQPAMAPPTAASAPAAAPPAANSSRANLRPQIVVLAGLTGAIFWNLLTWYYGIPSSSSHALIGGLCGAALAYGGGNVIIWYREPSPGSWQPQGLVFKVLLPIVVSPVGAFIVGYVVMSLIYYLFANAPHGRVSKLFRSLQIVSSAAMAAMHGSNDAQKSMGTITMAIASYHIAMLPAGTAVPDHLRRPEVSVWVKIACAIAMAMGTAAGGWRIIKTMGHKIIKLEPVHGFAAETSASLMIMLADYFKAPISTTHTISGSIFGVGSAKRLSAVRWSVAEQMVMAWILTLPAAGTVGAITFFVLDAIVI